MFKVILLSSAMFYFVGAANAQKFPSENIISRFELVAGPSFSRNTGYLEHYDSKTGYSFGVGYYQHFNKFFSVNLRALYEMKASAATYNYSVVDANGTIDINDRYTTKLKYLSFYLLPTLSLGRNKNIHISAGGYYSFLRNLNVNSYRTDAGTGEFISEYNNADKNYFRPDYDAGVSLQIGYSFNISEKSQLMLQAYSNRGLIDLSNPWIGSQRNNTFGLTLSFRTR